MTVRIKKGSNAIFDLTPMIDCVFQLLIFFLVVARFAEEEREMEVMLPEASQAQPLTARPQELFINIDDHGRYFVGGQSVNLGQLQNILKRAAANNPAQQSVVLRADRRCRWEAVVAVMNACQEVKIRNYRVTTREGPA
jgi:biopolymer transport protein ExbD